MQLWDIENHPELSIKGRFQRDHNGNEVWIVVGKRSWQLVGSVWKEQEEVEIYDDPVYLGEVGLSAMKADQEFSVVKTNTDVLIFGKARSYAKKAVTYHECRLLIDGHIDKTISVLGDRQWIEHGGSVTLSKPLPFVEKEIDFSCAIGGDLRNRLGGGIADTKGELLKQKVPSVFYPTEDWSATPKNTRVAGFGPLAPFFGARQQYAGTFDDDWLENRKPLYPVDFDQRFYQSAPLDQQCKGFISGGERLMMSGFCHNDALSFRFPKEMYVAEAQFKNANYQVDMPISTVFIDTEARILSISYSAAFPCQGEEHLLVSTKIHKKQELSDNE
ncbi:DUF2169 domain-containing protein [Vibrio lentus]|nr:DUF2169 domain-containing protein [Vibrio lentus]MCZ8502749.1 DUF2169 domain-containing protein [Vibrio lentus]PMH59714.1 hypothetical protein BCU64_21870 [Vibrio lentus]